MQVSYLRGGKRDRETERRQTRQRLRGGEDCEQEEREREKRGGRTLDTLITLEGSLEFWK
jgi:hypothetical protein